MGLIAREIEARGIPTLSMSSARSITAAVNPPRAVYVDYPLGHTAGKPDDPQNQDAIMDATLAAFAAATHPGEIVDLGLSWAETDEWKDHVMRPQLNAGGKPGQHEDDRVARHDTPQYQTEDDAAQADQHCPSCVFLEP